MKKYKVSLSNLGLDEIIVEAKTEEEAKEKVMEGEYDEKDVINCDTDFVIEGCEEIKPEKPLSKEQIRKMTREGICPKCGNENPPIRFCEKCHYEFLDFETANN